MKIMVASIITACTVLGFSSAALADAAKPGAAKTQSIEDVKKTQFVDDKGIAIHGYDPVSFFAGAGKPGVEQFSSKYHGATYLFADAADKAKFDAKPEAYVPQFGGYCAYGTAVGKKFRTEPDTGTVVGGKLYFNKDKSIQATWNKDIPGYITKANNNWPAVKRRSVDG